MGKETIEIREFVRQINKKFSPEKIILFGSRAKKDHLKDSDYDIIVVSKKFQFCRNPLIDFKSVMEKRISKIRVFVRKAKS